MTAKQVSSVLTIDELAEYLKISKSTLYKLAQIGVVRGQKVGRHWRFHRDAIDDWLRNERQTMPHAEIAAQLETPDEPTRTHH